MGKKPAPKKEHYYSFIEEKEHEAWLRSLEAGVPEWIATMTANIPQEAPRLWAKIGEEEGGEYLEWVKESQIVSGEAYGSLARSIIKGGNAAQFNYLTGQFHLFAGGEFKRPAEEQTQALLNHAYDQAGDEPTH